MTGAVIAALEQRLATEEKRHRAPKTSQEILDLAARLRRELPQGIRSEDHADLYGDDGLPR